LSSERVERRLTAILAADVAGYSRLMGADEEGTLAPLKAHRRALVDPKIPQDKRIEFRIGINVGDIIIDDDDIFGRQAHRQVQGPSQRDKCEAG